MLVKDLMIKDVRTIEPDASVAEIVEAMADSKVSGLPVVDHSGRVIGVVSTTDVLQAQSEQSDSRSRSQLFIHTTARDLMSHTPQVIEPDADAREAAKLMLYAEVRRLFVVDGHDLVGVISQTDIAHAVGTGRI